MKEIKLSKNQKNDLLNNGQNYPIYYDFNSKIHLPSSDEISDHAIETDHFIIFTYKGNPHTNKVLKQIATHSETYYKDVVSSLGIQVKQHKKFGIYLFEEKNSQFSGLGYQYGVSLKVPKSGHFPASKLEVFKHELVHMVTLDCLRNLRNNGYYMPRWLCEGLACLIAGQEILEYPEELEEVINDYGRVINPLEVTYSQRSDLCLYPAYTFAVKYLFDDKGGNLSPKIIGKFFARVNELFRDNKKNDCFEQAFSEIIANKIGFKSYRDFIDNFYKIEKKGNKALYGGKYKEFFEKFSVTISNADRQNQLMVLAGKSLTQKSLKIVLEAEIKNRKIFADFSDLPDGKYFMIFYKEEATIKDAKAKQIEIYKGKIKGIEKTIDLSFWDNSICKSLPDSAFSDANDSDFIYPKQSSTDSKNNHQSLFFNGHNYYCLNKPILDSVAKTSNQETRLVHASYTQNLNGMTLVK